MNYKRFGIEVILLHLFRKKDSKRYTESLEAFFQYVLKTELKDNLNVFDLNNNILLSYAFDFRKKTHITEQSRYALRCLSKEKKSLKFLGI